MTRFALILALIATSTLSTAHAGDCESFKGESACLAGKDFDSQGCEWCKSAAVPSSCHNATMSEGLPPSIFACDAAMEVKGDANYLVLALQKCQGSSDWTLHGLWPEWGQNCGKEVRGAARSDATSELRGQVYGMSMYIMMLFFVRNAAAANTLPPFILAPR